MTTRNPELEIRFYYKDFWFLRWVNYLFMMIRFKGSQYPKSVILYAIFFYVRYAVFYRDLQKNLQERGVDVDYTTLNRWVVKYVSEFATQAQKCKQTTAFFWRMNETYIKVKGHWV